MENKWESWWLLPLTLSPTYLLNEPVTLFTAIFCVALFTWLVGSLLCWAHPGGPAWGSYWLIRRNTTTTIEDLKRHIPGPSGFPLIGSIWLTAGLAHRHLNSAAEFFAAKRLMAFSLGNTRAIITSHPDVAKEMLNNPALADRPYNESAYGLMFHRAIGFAPYGDYWRCLRRVAASHLFSPKSVEGLASQRSCIAVEMVNAVSKYEDEGVQIRHVLKRASLCYIMEVVFGRKPDFAGKEVQELLAMVEEGYKLLGENNWSDHVPVLAALDLQKIRSRCSKLVPRVYNFVLPIIKERRAAAQQRASPDFICALISLALADDDLAAIVWEMVFRGTDTMAVLMEWALARLVLHQDIQSKVHQELVEVVGSSIRPVTEHDVSSLPYLQAVLKEVVRLHPPGPLLGWRRQASSDTLIDGHFVPAGTTAMVNMWAIARDPIVWNEPLDFRPERFVANISAGEMNFSIFGSDLRLAPFGAGKRSCPGKGLAWNTVCLWLANLLHAFQWLPSARRGVDLLETMRLSCEMENPLEVEVSCRLMDN